MSSVIAQISIVAFDDTPGKEDVTWIKHECAERHHELKYDSGYSEAHDRAQSRYDGYPWENKF